MQQKTLGRRVGPFPSPGLEVMTPSLLKFRATCPEVSWRLHEETALPAAQTGAASRHAAAGAAEVPSDRWTPGLFCSDVTPGPET